jgi:hypothetical protein
MQSRRRHHLLAAIAIAAAIVIPPARAAHAQSAETLFKEGRAAANRSDWATACSKFEESQRLDPAPGTLANLATCEERQGHLVRSSEYARQAVADLPPGDGRRDVVKKLLADLERRIPKLTIRLASGAPRDAKVTLDGKELEAASLGTALPVDPGEHSVSVTATGRSAKETDVTVAEGAAKDLVVEAGAEDDAGAAAPARSKSKKEATTTAPMPATSPEPPTSPLRVAGFVVGGLGLASIAVGGITGGMVFGKKKTVQEHCNADKECDQEGLDAGSSGTTLATVSTITFAAGAGALAGGVLLVLLGRPEARVTVGPTASAAGPGVMVGGRFE